LHMALSPRFHHPGNRRGRQGHPNGPLEASRHYRIVRDSGPVVIR
jgi:hypothetical protein